MRTTDPQNRRTQISFNDSNNRKIDTLTTPFDSDLNIQSKISEKDNQSNQKRVNEQMFNSQQDNQPLFSNNNIPFDQTEVQQFKSSANNQQGSARSMDLSFQTSMGNREQQQQNNFEQSKAIDQHGIKNRSFINPKQIVEPTQQISTPSPNSDQLCFTSNQYSIFNSSKVDEYYTQGSNPTPYTQTTSGGALYSQLHQSQKTPLQKSQQHEIISSPQGSLRRKQSSEIDDEDDGFQSDQLKISQTSITGASSSPHRSKIEIADEPCQESQQLLRKDLSSSLKNDLSPKKQLYRWSTDLRRSLFQSVGGYFFQNPSSKASATVDNNGGELDVEKYSNIVLYEIPKQHLKLLQKDQLVSLITEYFPRASQKIPRINRDICGLSSASNLGDYFLSKYAGHLDKKIAGCASAQRFPVHIGVRGDGNCFYRAVITSYLVRIFMGREFGEVEEIICRLAGGKETKYLLELTMKGNIRDDGEVAREMLIRHLVVLLVERVRMASEGKDFEGPQSDIPSENLQLFIMAMLELIAEDHDLDYSLVLLCRSIISHAVHEHAKDPQYAEFLLPEDVERTLLSLREYKEDAEFHAVFFSATALGVPIQILQLQQDKRGWFQLDESLSYQPQKQKSKKTPDVQDRRKVVLLLSQGHYDLVVDSITCRHFFPHLALFNGHAEYKQALCEVLKDEKLLRDMKEKIKKLQVEYEEFLVEQNKQMQRVARSMERMKTVMMMSRGVAGYTNDESTPAGMIKMSRGNSDLSESVLSSSKMMSKVGTIEESASTRLKESLGNIIEEKQSTFPQKQQEREEEKSNNHQSMISGVEDQRQEARFMGSRMTGGQKVIGKSNVVQLSSQFDREYTLQKMEVVFQQRFYSAQKWRQQIKYKGDENTYQMVTSGQEGSVRACDHAKNDRIIVNQIVCCKVSMEICYMCYKTRQIIQCPVCRKDVLSSSRIAMTAKNCRYSCKPCIEKLKEGGETAIKDHLKIVVLFNRLLCEECDGFK